jgi:hypothetical protein
MRRQQSLYQFMINKILMLRNTYQVSTEVKLKDNISDLFSSEDLSQMELVLYKLFVMIS